MLIAPDKFKGSLRADEVAEHLTSGIRAVRPSAKIVTRPVADGGDGTLLSAISDGFRQVDVDVTGPTGTPVASAIAVRDSVAVIELARAAGLELLPGGRPDPLGATSHGVGELLRAALDAGCSELVLGVGGSACTDGGAGMLQALGARLTDRDGSELPQGGASLDRLHAVDFTGLDSRLSAAKVILASDVDNPLLGPNGGVQVYGPQKGAGPDDLRTLESALGHWAALVNPGAAVLPGAGAAGGVGFAALAVLRAEHRQGVDVVLDLIKFDSALADCDLVIVGEGCLDAQTLSGKAPAGVAARAKRAGIPVVAVCGQCRLGPGPLASVGIAQAYALNDVEPDLGTCMTKPGPILRRLARKLATDWVSSGDPAAEST